MHFTWVACEPNCRGWIGAVGIVTGDTPKNFDDFARGRDLGGATIVLDSNGGAVNDAIALGRRSRKIDLQHRDEHRFGRIYQRGAAGLVQIHVRVSAAVGQRPVCARKAHVRVHQIWMGDRTENAKASTYTAQDVMIVERDIGRLAKYTFDMAGLAICCRWA